MWELIQANKRKSILLFMGMGVCLLILGYFAGYALFGPDQAFIGLAFALVLFVILSLVSYFSGDTIMLHLSGAKEVDHDVHPQLYNIVEEMKIASSLPAMPRVYIIPDAAPNAFATGRNPQRSAIAVTAGLLGKLNRDELQGVIAHEMSHIMNRDVAFMTFAGILLGSIVMVSEVFLRTMWYTGGSSRRYSSRKSGKGGGQAQMIMIVISIVLAILAPIIARLLYFAISRKREYLADACAARLTRYPEGLASALEKISRTTLDLSSRNKAMASMYIINPFKKKGMMLSNLSSTHPPIRERVEILRGMGHGAGYRDYQKAYSAVKGTGKAVIPQSGLADKTAVGIREPSVEAKKPSSKKFGMREVGDMMRAMNRYLFLACVCGLRMKIPPDFKRKSIDCPRCGRETEVPIAQLAAIGAIAGAIGGQTEQMPGAELIPGMADKEMLTYTRKGHGWETFSCKCGAPIQLSPHFGGSHINCRVCGKRIVINS